MRLTALLSVAAVLAACAAPHPATSVPAPPAARGPVVLVSIDGLRHDALDRAGVEAPALRRLAAEGARADHLVPVYPTKTFPNHYSLVTGLHPEAHGLVNNTMRDPGRLVDGRPARFSLSDRAAVADGAWWGGEPIWVTAERQGVRAATVFWPGSEAAIGGVRPSRWLPYDGDMPYAARVDTVLAWLSGPAPARLATLYFEGVDTAGHRHGPDAPETAAAIAEVDAAMARLVAGLAARGIEATIVVVSDHGMVAVSPDRVVVLDDAIDLDAVDEVMWGEPVGIWPGAADADSLVARLDALPHLDAMRREAVPERLHYRASDRIPAIVLMADEGWTVTSRAGLARRAPTGGAHGYDNALPSMHGVFFAAGPAVRAGAEIGAVQAVDVYALLAQLLGVRPAAHAGDATLADRVLR